MASPAIHRTHSVENWVYLDDLRNAASELPGILSMAQQDHAASTTSDLPFSPAVGIKDGRPALLWHHTSTSNSHQGILFIPPEVGGTEKNEPATAKEPVAVVAPRRAGKATARQAIIHHYIHHFGGQPGTMPPADNVNRHGKTAEPDPQEQRWAAEDAFLEAQRLRTLAKTVFSYGEWVALSKEAFRLESSVTADSCAYVGGRLYAAAGNTVGKRGLTREEALRIIASHNLLRNESRPLDQIRTETLLAVVTDYCKLRGEGSRA